MPPLTPLLTPGPLGGKGRNGGGSSAPGRCPCQDPAPPPASSFPLGGRGLRHPSTTATEALRHRWALAMWDTETPICPLVPTPSFPLFPAWSSHKHLCSSDLRLIGQGPPASWRTICFPQSLRIKCWLRLQNTFTATPPVSDRTPGRLTAIGNLPLPSPRLSPILINFLFQVFCFEGNQKLSLQGRIRGDCDPGRAAAVLPSLKSVKTRRHRRTQSSRRLAHCGGRLPTPRLSLSQFLCPRLSPHASTHLFLTFISY